MKKTKQAIRKEALAAFDSLLEILRLSAAADEASAISDEAFNRAKNYRKLILVQGGKAAKNGMKKG